MELVSPGIGLVFWMTLAFGIVLWILKKFAWKPIMEALKQREDSIDNALQEADKAREETKELEKRIEQLEKKAKHERDNILRQAREIKKEVIEKARLKANEESNIIIENALETIEHEKIAAMIDLKNQIAKFSIEIAEKLLTEELSDKVKQKKYVDKLITEFVVN